MATEELKVDCQIELLTLTIDRPHKHNALSPEVLAAITEALDGVSPDVRAVVLRGAGRVAFSAGYDLGRIEPPDTFDPDPDQNPVLRTVRAIRECQAPVIAAIFGYAYGAGFHIAAACDLRVVAESARFCMPPAKLGILYNPEGLLTFTELLGVSNAKELFLTARPIDARRAEVMGIANWVVPDDDLEPFVSELVTGIAKHTSPFSVARIKAMLNTIQAASLDPDYVAAFGREVFDSLTDGREFKPPSA